MLSELWGFGGDLRAEKLLRISRKTVHKGRRELKSGHIDPDRIRKVGGGRPSIEKKRHVIKRIEELMEFETAGSPMGEGLYWTYRSPSNIAKQLGIDGYNVSATTMRKIFCNLGYSVRKNRRCLSRHSPSGQDQQFRKISALILFCQAHQIPIFEWIQKERTLRMVHQCRGGWCKNAIAVNDHDFPSYSKGKAVPYGIYDRIAHRGSVYVGDSKDTPEFAVDCIAKWFATEGKTHYSNTNRLVTLADCGGSIATELKHGSIFYKKRFVIPINCW